VVTGIDPNGTAAEHGIKTGDVILQIGGHAVSGPADVRKDLAQLSTEGKRTALMRVKSGDATRFVALPLKSA
jgi:serine protease Do